MRRAKGATLQEIMKATGWQAHTVRGLVSGTLIKKQRLKVESLRNNDNERVLNHCRGPPTYAFPHSARFSAGGALSNPLLRTGAKWRPYVPLKPSASLPQ
jgi:hypothetical protein